VDADRLAQSTAALEAETSVRGLLAATTREMVEVLGATACAVSRVIGDLLVGLDEFSHATRPLEHGHEYLISDYPLTKQVIDSGSPQRVARVDEDAEPTEVDLLQKLGFDSLLMVCLPAHEKCWGLIEVYCETGRFDEGQEALARRLTKVAGKRLEQLAPE
jgi:transcriptional regulator with GAF, ATPase, and Fis domain